MAEFNSPIGGRKFTGAPLREFNVPDESLEQFQERANHSAQDLAQVEQEIRASREAKRSGKERLDEGAKTRLEMLLGMTRSTRSVKIEEADFVLQTLKGKEMRQAIMNAAEYDGSVQSPFEMRRQLLTYSLVKIGGIDINQFIGSDEFSKKLEWVEELPDDLLNKLYSEYLVLVEESKQKYGVKNNEEAMKVVEDLKK